MLMFYNYAIAQNHMKVIGQSNEINFKTNREATPVFKPPYLEILDCRFSDSDGNNIIDAGETTSIHFDLSNNGTGEGKNLTLVFEDKNGVSGLIFKHKFIIKSIAVNERRKVSIPVKGDFNLLTSKALFSIQVKEENGFNSNPVLMEVATKAFREPLVKIVDYQLSSQNSSTLEKRKPFDLQILVQNIGQGVANDVTVSLHVPQNVFCLSTNNKETPGTIQPGEKSLLTYNLVANNEFNSPEMEIRFSVHESFGKYAENDSVTLTMNQEVSTEKLIIDGESSGNVSIEIASLSSDVDKNIPDIERKFPNKVALIIGNENYSEQLNANVNVDFARRDAEVFREYILKTLGFEEKNIIFLQDASSGTMKREIDRVVEIVKRMGNQTELLFYYAGHGFPDENQFTPYLIPIDVSASNLVSAIPLNEIYKKFGQTGAKKITVILDACFSGGGRNHGLLASRGVRIIPREEDVAGNMVVFTASSGDQSALSFKEKKHGMFSYFFLKKLKETKGTVSFGELFKYVKRNVGIESLRINEKEQDPSILFSPAVAEEWNSFTF